MKWRRMDTESVSEREEMEEGREREWRRERERRVQGRKTTAIKIVYFYHHQRDQHLLKKIAAFPSNPRQVRANFLPLIDA